MAAQNELPTRGAIRYKFTVVNVTYISSSVEGMKGIAFHLTSTWGGVVLLPTLLKQESAKRKKVLQQDNNSRGY